MRVGIEIIVDEFKFQYISSEPVLFIHHAEAEAKLVLHLSIFFHNLPYSPILPSSISTPEHDPQAYT
jgi:hypothetical protein